MVIVILFSKEEAQKFQWVVTQHGDIVEIAYGKDTNFPQYAVLYLNSSYFRMNYGPESGWGTSVILAPSFWEKGQLYQDNLSNPISYTYKTVEGYLELSFSGRISSLNFSGKLRIAPPESNLISADVEMAVEGDVDLDDRPSEAFKPMMLSSMHVSQSMWDAQKAYIGSQLFEIPEEGWIINPALEGSIFGLIGGTSDWQRENGSGPAPTIEIILDRPMKITGWVTPSNNPNDDNVGFWAARNQVIRSWRYKIVVKKP